MRDDAARRKGALDTALLFLSRDPSSLAALLQRLLPPAELQKLARLGGRKKSGRPQPSLQVAEFVAPIAKLRKATVAALEVCLPEVAEASDMNAEEAARAEPGLLLQALAFDLTTADEAARERLTERLDSWLEFLPVLEDQAPTKKAAASPTEDVAVPVADKAEVLKEQLRVARRETARLEEELGLERRRRAELKEQLAEADGERRVAEQRASEWKKRLAASTEASEREQLLVKEAEEARLDLHVAQQKVELLSFEREDLRAVLEDRDRFEEYREEVVPSFRNRPLLDKENALAARLESHGNRFRVLVVGGGEPQYRHRDKFEEYAEVMGFQGTWRMAEYVSWHKEMDKLATDMNTRYDALVILHWNRTTFTRNARDVCNKAGQKPCITCYYEGFTSLRETLQECLRQLLDR
ncbi:MAG: hypothetical protein ACPG31_03580 [Planctomycetota bacterium]